MCFILNHEKNFNGDFQVVNFFFLKIQFTMIQIFKYKFARKKLIFCNFENIYVDQ